MAKPLSFTQVSTASVIITMAHLVAVVVDSRFAGLTEVAAIVMAGVMLFRTSMNGEGRRVDLIDAIAQVVLLALFRCAPPLFGAAVAAVVTIGCTLYQEAKDWACTHNERSPKHSS